MLIMSFSATQSSVVVNLNDTVLGELFVENDSMTKVNITADMSMSVFSIPTILVVIIVNSASVILFRSLEPNVVYKMIIYDSINNILQALVSFCGSNFKHRLPYGPICGLSEAFNYGFGTFNRLVPLVIVIFRYRTQVNTVISQQRRSCNGLKMIGSISKGILFIHFLLFPRLPD